MRRVEMSERFPEKWFTDEKDQEPKEIRDGKKVNRISAVVGTGQEKGGGEKGVSRSGTQEEIKVQVLSVNVYERMRKFAPRPTLYLPGTPEKVAVMKWRYEMGYQIFHPMDATYEDMTNMYQRWL
jgi:hypothetical protein